MKRVVAVLLVLAALCGMTAALAAGTQSDPLISRSYVDGAYRTSLRTLIDDTIAKSTQAARLASLESQLGLEFARGFGRMQAGLHARITLVPGSSFTLASGSAKIYFDSGRVINVTSGSTVNSNFALERNHRYFCAENTTASIIAFTPATGYVDGYHKVELNPTYSTPPQPIRSTGFTLSDNLVFGLSPNLTVANFIAGLSSDGFSLTLTDSAGARKASGNVASGDRLVVMDGDIKVKEYTLILRGDVSGNGQIALLDLLMVQRHLLRVRALDGYAFIAADVNRDNTIALIDLLMIQRHLLGVTAIEQ